MHLSVVWHPLVSLACVSSATQKRATSCCLFFLTSAVLAIIVPLRNLNKSYSTTLPVIVSIYHSVFLYFFTISVYLACIPNGLQPLKDHDHPSSLAFLSFDSSSSSKTIGSWWCALVEDLQPCSCLPTSRFLRIWEDFDDAPLSTGHGWEEPIRNPGSLLHNDAPAVMDSTTFPCIEEHLSWYTRSRISCCLRRFVDGFMMSPAGSTLHPLIFVIVQTRESITEMIVIIVVIKRQEYNRGCQDSIYGRAWLSCHLAGCRS